MPFSAGSHTRHEGGKAGTARSTPENPGDWLTLFDSLAIGRACLGESPWRRLNITDVR